MVVVEGAEALVGGTGRAQGDVAADDLDDVEGFFDLLYPVARQGATQRQEPWRSLPHRDEGSRLFRLHCSRAGFARIPCGKRKSVNKRGFGSAAAPFIHAIIAVDKKRVKLGKAGRR